MTPLRAPLTRAEQRVGVLERRASGGQLRRAVAALGSAVVLIVSVFGVLGAALPGCSWERPEAPSFDTVFNVPLGEYTYTGADLASSLQSVAGDTSKPGPLVVCLGDEAEPIELGDGLALDAEGVEAELKLEAFQIEGFSQRHVFFGVGQLLPDSLPLGLETVLPSFEFAPDPMELEACEDLEWAELTSGTLRLTLSNGLPVPIGGRIASRKVVLVIDALIEGGAMELARIEIEEEIAPDCSVTKTLDLSGATVTDRLRISLRGGSRGSGLAPVRLEQSHSIDLEVGMEELEASRLRGQPPEFEIENTFTIGVAEGLEIQEAVVDSGRALWRVTNNLPVEIEVSFSCVELEDGAGLAFERTFRVPPRIDHLCNLDFTGYRLSVPGGKDGIEWKVEARSVSGGGSVLLEAGEGAQVQCTESAMHFESVRGKFDRVPVPVGPVEIEMEFPPESEGVEFAAAEATLEVGNTTELSLDGEFQLVGAAGSDTVAVDFNLEVPAGTPQAPGFASVTLTEADSRILDLLLLRPESAWLRGTVYAGDGQEATVTPEDVIVSAYAVRIPMKLRLSEAHYDGEPFPIEMDEAVEDQVTRHMRRLSVAGGVENHFPATARIRFHFAQSEEKLFVDDALVIESDPIASAVVDSVTGRVTASTFSDLRMVVEQGDLDVFALGDLYGAISVVLDSPEGVPVEIWTTDYISMSGIVSFEYRIE